MTRPIQPRRSLAGLLGVAALWLAVAVAGRGAGRLGAQESTPSQPATEELQSLLDRLRPETRAAVADLLDSARAERLPLRPLVDKALEGEAKGAPAERIAAAVRDLAHRLALAQASLGSGASADELAAGASALRAGASPATLAGLRQARTGGNQTLAVPLGVLCELLARGVTSDTASAVVLALAKAAKDRDLIAFRNDVDHDVALGAPPSVSAALRAADAEAGFPGSAIVVTTPGSKPASPPPPTPARP